MYTENETITALPFNYHIARPVNNSSQNFDLEGMIAIMKLDKKWKTGEMNMMVLLRNPNNKIVLTILHENTEIQSSQVNDSITFQVIDGKLKLNFLEESCTLHKGDILTLNEKTSYNIYSIEESTLLMTLAS
jgi:quercetin dioxygenase-like cupin family protein